MPAVTKYIDSVKSEGNFVPKAGAPATITSIRDGLLASGHSGVSADKSSIEAFVRSVYDAESKLFSSRQGATPSIKATAEALEVLSLAGLSTREWGSKTIAAVKELLTSSIKEEGSSKFFSFEGVTGDKESFEANVHALIAAHYAGVTLANPRAFANYFVERTHQRSGGIAFAATALPTLESTTAAISALHAIERSSGFNALASINTEAIMQILYPLGHELSKVALSHQAFAYLSNFKDVFHVEVKLETASAPVDSRNPSIVQGAQVTPFVMAMPFNQPHAGLNVEAIVSHASSSDKKYKLLWNPDRFGYTTEEAFDTTGKLGELSIVVKIGVPVVGETLGFTATEKFNIGYTMTVKPSAKVAGRDIKPTETVTVGTEFSFDVSVATTAPLSTGAFDLVFSVLDSSDVIVEQSSKNYAKSGAEVSHFTFELKRASLPAGVLTFRFHVLDHATNTIHTQHRVQYDLQLTMVASQIKIGDGSSLKPTFKLGDSAKISFVPASFPDLVNLHTYSAVDALGEDVTAARKFFVDTMDAGVVLRSFAAEVAKDASGQTIVVSSTITFPALFDAIGTHHLRFRYTPASGSDVVLALYDSEAHEQFDDHVEVGLVVKSDLYITELTNAPKGGSLSYGDPVTFSFKVKDRLSGEFVNSYGSNSVFLVLSNKDAQGKSYVSARHAVSTDPRGGFEADWAVNPNAVSGKGVIQLQAAVLGGEEITLATEDRSEFAVNVVIGGDITHTSTVRQISVPHGSHAAVVVEFELACQKRVLTGALLTAGIFRNGQLVGYTPVARSDDEDKYTVSWAIPEADASSGQYTVSIHRQADKGSSRGAAIFEIPVAVVGATTHYLPFRTEAVLFFGSLALFGVFSYRKWLIERK
jgi:hypothetical protein